MTMLTPADIEARCRKLWDSQQVLRAFLTDEPFFPREFPLGLPAGEQLLDNLAEVRSWLKQLRLESKEAKGFGYRLVEREFRFRRQGTHRLPYRAVIDGLEDLLKLIGKQAAFSRFVRLQAETRARVPELLPMLAASPLRILDEHANWSQVLSVCQQFREGQVQGRYLRQLDIEGVDTKFIETKQALLWDALKRVLPPERQDERVTGLKDHGFERRFGLRYDPPLIRFRLLDPALKASGLTDLSVPLDDFAAFPPDVDLVFMTENKVNGLAFPPVPRAMVVFGMGYAIRSLVEATWLEDKQIVYWGDIDTHGFAMLSLLRRRFPRTLSMLMGLDTLLACRALWGVEPAETRFLQELDGLTEEEREVFELLKANALGNYLRLEQERIPFRILQDKLAAFSMIRGEHPADRQDFMV